MFDLRFFKRVSSVIAWTGESPRLVFANVHEQYIHSHVKRLDNTSSAQRKALDTLEEDHLMLKQYVLQTYLPYFGLKMNFGRHASLVSDQLLFRY